MPRFSLVLMGLGVACAEAGAFGPTAHAYLAMQAAGTQSRDIIFGAIVPDCSGILTNENPAEASTFNHMTHFEFGRLAESCFAAGFSTHNGTWGADYYAHLFYDPNAEDIYSIIKIRQLSTEFGISMQRGEDLFEMAIDYLIRLDYGPEIGALMALSAAASGAANEQALVDAFAAELAGRVAGLSVEQAEAGIRHAHQAYKELITVFGQQLKQAPEPLRATLMPLLAGYLGTDVPTASTYFSRAIEICADYQTEMDRIVANLRPLLPQIECEAAEGEGAWEGEGEEAYEVDFCEAFLSVATNPLLSQIGAQFMELVAIINPQTADLNGSFNVDITDEEHPLVEAGGNGIMDAANELALLSRILATPGFNNGILAYEEVRAAWEHNRSQLLDGNIGPTFAPVLVPLVPGLLEILTGYVTIGDGELTMAAYYRASGQGSFGFVAALFTLLNDAMVDRFGSGVDQPQLRTGDFVRLGALWPSGDADGDGYTNLEEFGYFTPVSCPAVDKSDPGIDYVTAALYGWICPGCPECPDCTPTPGGLFEAGSDACLHVPGVMLPETTFLWSKEGAGPLQDGRFAGVRCQSLHIPLLRVEDSGTYTCTYGGGKAVHTVTILVGEGMPLLGPAGLGLVALAAALLGARRMKRPGRG